MITPRSVSALIGIASCIASFLAGIAYADGFGETSSGADETIVAPITETCALELAAGVVGSGRTSP